MSRENVELVRWSLALWSSGDLQATLRVFDADFEIDWSLSRGPQQGVYRGEAAVRWLEEWQQLFDEVRIEPLDFVDTGEHVVVPNRTHLRGRDGITVEATSAFVYTIRERLIARIKLFQDAEAALAADSGR